MPRRVTCIPSTDEAFKRIATLALQAIDGAIPVDDVAAALAGRLRDRYPAVVVHRQDTIARVLDVDVWYVYRDRTNRVAR